MQESRKASSHDFETELENRLNQLSNRRSQKKIPKAEIQSYHPHYYDDSEENIDRYSKITEQESNESVYVVNTPSPKRQ